MGMEKARGATTPFDPHDLRDLSVSLGWLDLALDLERLAAEAGRRRQGGGRKDRSLCWADGRSAAGYLVQLDDGWP